MNHCYLMHPYKKYSFSNFTKDFATKCGALIHYNHLEIGKRKVLWDGLAFPMVVIADVDVFTEEQTDLIKKFFTDAGALDVTEWYFSDLDK